MNADPRLLDLLADWDERRRRGSEPTPQELCPGDPTLQAELERRIRRRKALEPLLETTADSPADGRSAGIFPAFADYEVLGILGQGGMGVVYRARQKGLNRLVALKMILGGAAAGPLRSRFQTEAEAVAKLQHPNIVAIHEVGDHDGSPFLVLEYLPGNTLAKLARESPLTPQRAAYLVAILARAVHHAHQHGIVHRDLKPANVLFSADDVPKIADFGLAKRLDLDQMQTQTGALLGTPSYMAPEQAEGRSRDIGPGVDIYALGAILYELLTGRPPHHGTTLMETLEQVRHHDPAPPGRLRPEVPRDLEVICLKCLEKDPRDRYPTAEALAHDLERFQNGEPISARSLTFFEQLTRAVRHLSLDAGFHRLYITMLACSPLPLALHLGVFLLFQHQPYFAEVSLGVSTVFITLLMAAVVWGHRATVRGVPTQQRRFWWSLWAGHGPALILVVVVCWLAGVENLLIVYPLWMIVAGMTFMSVSNLAGVFALTSVAVFSLAIVTALNLHIAPIILGALMSANTLVMGLLLRRLAKKMSA